MLPHEDSFESSETSLSADLIAATYSTAWLGDDDNFDLQTNAAARTKPMLPHEESFESSQTSLSACEQQILDVCNMCACKSKEGVWIEMIMNLNLEN